MSNKNRKAYFVTSDKEEVYELSISKTKQLHKLFPNWNELDCENNYEELAKVYEFFQTHGKLIACPKFNNVFVGLTV